MTNKTDRTFFILFPFSVLTPAGVSAQIKSAPTKSAHRKTQTPLSPNKFQSKSKEILDTHFNEGICDFTKFFIKMSMAIKGYIYPGRQKYPYIYFMKFVWQVYYSTVFYLLQVFFYIKYGFSGNINGE